MRRTITVTIEQYGCDECDYVWAPRKSNPKVCPRCKSEKWDDAHGNTKTVKSVPVSASGQEGKIYTSVDEGDGERVIEYDFDGA